MRALLRAYPYTSLLVLAIIVVPLIWGINVITKYHPSDLGDAIDMAASALFGAGWIAKWGSK